MKLPYSWVKQYVATRTPAPELAERFRLTSSEAESVLDCSVPFRGLVVGRIVSAEPHPNADRLQLTRVDVGESEPRQIVCGAPNARAGVWTVVALPGTELHPVQGAAFTIQQTVIRGVASDGMLCAYQEIGLNLPSQGIIELPEARTAGSPAAAALDMDDWVIDLEITPNRPDLLSVYGLAREASSFEHRALSAPKLLEESAFPSSIKPSAFSADLCRRYTGLLLTGCQAGDSPLWMRQALLKAGQKPINAIVDVTNYVMLELGLPLHAFDADRLGVPGGLPGIRAAKNGERLACLDGSVRTLSRQDVVVTGASGKAVALAGIIGGSETAVTSQTSNVFLEAAVFDGSRIRRASQRYGLRTEASTRMEKGLDPYGLDAALRRAALLLREMTGASIGEFRIDSGIDPYAGPSIFVGYEFIQSILGVRLNLPESKQILTSLGFAIAKVTKSGLTVVPPHWRQDVRLPEDVLEELIRIWGYHKIPGRLPVGNFPAPRPNTAFSRKQTIRRSLASLGLHEAVSLSLTSEQALVKSGIPAAAAVPVLQPLSKEGEYLLPEHLPAFLQNISGTNRGHVRIGLFEIGSVFRPQLSEVPLLSLLLRGETDHELLYRQAKGIVERLAAVLNARVAFCDAAGAPAWYAAGQAVAVLCDGEPAGWMGMINDEVLGAWKIRSGRAVAYASMDLTQWLTADVPVRRVSPAAQFPTVERDFTLTIPEREPAGEMLSAAAECQALRSAAPTLESVFREPPVPAGHKAVTIRLSYGSDERTLTDSEVDADLQRVTADLSAKFHAIT